MRAYLYPLMKKRLLSLLLISTLNTSLYSQDVIDDKKYFFSGNININNNNNFFIKLTLPLHVNSYDISISVLWK